MEKRNFRQAIEEIYGYFRYSTLPTELSIDRWYEKVKWIPDIKLATIVSAIENLDSLPRNIPNLFIAKYKQLPGRKHKYDSIEDYRYPMDFLWKALDVLKDSGDQAFEKYCAEVQVPKNDIERVRCKFKAAYSYQDVKNLVREKLNETSF